MDEIDEILKFDPGSQKVEKESPGPDIVDEVLKFDPSPKADTPPDTQENPREVDLSWKDALVEGFQNIPSSAWETAKNMVEPIIHPIATGKAVGRLAAGTIQKVTPGKQEYEADFDAVVNFFKQRYGNIENFKKTLAEDPVGISVDIASIFTGAGAAARGVGAAGKISKVSKVGRALTQAGGTLEPINVARRIAALPLKLVPESTPMHLYQSAVKFGTTLSGKERDAVTRTALKARNQIMPTSKGMEKLGGMIDSYNEKISDLISSQVTQGSAIKVDRLYQGLDVIKDQFKKMSDEPKTWDSAFNNVKKQWDEALKIGDTRTPQEVQKIKTRIYRDLESLYEKHKASPAKQELRMAIAKNAREALEDIIPEIKQLNKEEGSLLELKKAIESKANRITNRDLIGIGLPVKMGTGSGIGYMFGGPTGGSIGTALGFTLGVFDTPQIKTKISLVLSRLKEKGITIKPTTAAMRLGFYQAGRDDSQNTQIDEPTAQLYLNYAKGDKDAARKLAKEDGWNF